MTPSSSNTVRYGIIGCGMMGQEHLRNIALLPGPDGPSRRPGHRGPLLLIGGLQPVINAP